MKSHRLAWGVLLACTATVGLALALIGARQTRLLTEDFKQELKLRASLAAKEIAPLLSGSNTLAITQVLQDLRAQTGIQSASVQLPDGTLLATSTDSAKLPQEEALGTSKLLDYSEPINLPAKAPATLYIRYSEREVVQNIVADQARMFAVTLAVCFLASVYLAVKLEKIFSAPVAQFVETARRVAESRDYSARAEVGQNKELSVFARAFNQMLEQIQSQDSALRHSTRRYETLVNSIDGVVWESDAVTLDLTFISEQAERLLGFSVDRCLKEDNFWQRHVHPEEAPVLANFLQELAKREPGKNYEYRLQGLSGCVWKPVDKSKPLVAEYRFIAADGRVLWLRNVASVVEEDGKRLLRGVLWDISEQKLAAQQLELLHQQLLQVSRQAGMAEVATEVLHNVGNVLNSINISSSFIRERLQESEVKTLVRVASLLGKHQGNELQFLTEDPKGKIVPQLLVQLGEELDRERQELERESETLINNIEHVKGIVRMQQNYAKVTGTEESVALHALVDEALEITAEPLRSDGIEIVREYEPLPKITIDKHKVLQIVVNLLRNAKAAMEAPTVQIKRLKLKISGSPDTAWVVVEDSGVGIPPDHLTRIFGHGFTTKKDGHGFGLHSGALTAKEMGGSLVAQSDGDGQGATFTLELPYGRNPRTA